MERPLQEEKKDETVFPKSETGETSRPDDRVESQNHSPTGLRNRLELNGIENRNLPSSSSTAPSSSNPTTPSINRQPSQNQGRGRINNNVNNNNAAVTDTMYQFQVRCVIFLVIAIIIGYLYVQIEHQSIVNRKFQLVPNSYSSMSGKSASQQNSQKKSSSQSTPEPVSKPASPTTTTKIKENKVFKNLEQDKPMIDPKYELQAKYLSKVLKTLGDLSRRIEATDNITKPIQGIIEMNAETESKVDVPEYMQRLGSIISDIKKSKAKNGEPTEKLKKPAFDHPRETKVGQEEEQTNNGEDNEQQKWNSFVNELVDAVNKINHEKDEDEDGESHVTYKYVVKNTIKSKNEEDDDGQFFVGDKKQQVNKLVPSSSTERDSLIKSNDESQDDSTTSGREEEEEEFHQQDKLTDLEMDEMDFDAELDALEEDVLDSHNIYYESKFTSTGQDSSSKEKKEGETFTTTDGGEEDQVTRQEKIQSRLRLLEKLLEASKEDLEAQVSQKTKTNVFGEEKDTRSTESKRQKDTNKVTSTFEDDQLHILE